MIRLVRSSGHELDFETKTMLLRKYSFLKDQSNSGFVRILAEVFGPIDQQDQSLMKQPLDEGTVEVNRRQKLHAFSEVEEHHSVGEAEFEERRPLKAQEDKIERASELPL